MRKGRSKSILKGVKIKSPPKLLSRVKKLRY